MNSEAGPCSSAMCNGTCVDIETDPSNCGGCGQKCPEGATCGIFDGGIACSPRCTEGTCPSGTACIGPVCLSTTCGPNQLNCALPEGGLGGCCGATTCDDLSKDPQNCGECTYVCDFGPGEICFQGLCTTPPVDCATAAPGSPCVEADGGLGECCGTCVDPQSFSNDPNDCTGCGSICPEGATCSGGCTLECNLGAACPTGTVCWGGVTGIGPSCLTTACDEASARKPCGLPTTPVSAGVCCGSSCADTSSDSANCGACGNACGAGMFCTDSTCAPTPTCAIDNSGVPCPVAGGSSDGTCCSGTCMASFAADPSNCGGCGVACATGGTCMNGLCSGGSGCPAGTLSTAGGPCLATTCATGESGVACALNANEAGLCCNGVCVDVDESPSSCGACGVACASGECSGGKCVPIPQENAPPSCGAPGVAYDDPLLGTECATNCPAAPPVTYCGVGGAVGVCCPTSTAFDAPSACTNLGSDPSNCGACNQVCPSGQTCSGGVCSGAVSTCGVGRDDAYCDLAAGPSWICCGGACANTNTDSKNCGQCDAPCGGTSACLNGTCVTASCTGQADGAACNASGAVGACCGGTCEATASDPTNCGTCGVHCATSSGQTCEGGLCGVNACTPQIQGDPCHIDTAGAISVGVCCGVACVDTADDPANCGGCSIACSGGETCAGGNCE